jgi:hypothetical protein
LVKVSFISLITSESITGREKGIFMFSNCLFNSSIEYSRSQRSYLLFYYSLLFHFSRQSREGIFF